MYPFLCSEKVYIPATKPYISLIGSQAPADGVVITWHDKASDLDAAGYPLGTFSTATVTVESHHFCAAGITFEVPLIYNNGYFSSPASELSVFV